MRVIHLQKRTVAIVGTGLMFRGTEDRSATKAKYQQLMKERTHARMDALTDRRPENIMSLTHLSVAEA